MTPPRFECEFSMLAHPGLNVCKLGLFCIMRSRSSSSVIAVRVIRGSTPTLARLIVGKLSPDHADRLDIRIPPPKQE